MKRFLILEITIINFIKKTLKNRIVQAGSFTFMDQLSISFIQFSAGIIFIYFGKPEEYGIYTVFISVLMFFQGIQNCLVNTPLIVLLPKLEPKERKIFQKGIVGIFLIMLPLFGISFLIWSKIHNTFSTEKFKSTWIIIFTFIILFFAIREFIRAKFYSELKPYFSFRMNFIYAILTFVITLLIIINGYFNLETLLLSICISAFISLFISYKNDLFIKGTRTEILTTFKQVWTISKWALLGGTSTWLQNNIYIALMFFFFGVKQLAYLASAHLLLKPIILFSRSWGNYFRPVVSHYLARGEKDLAIKLFIKSTCSILIALILYTFLIIMAFTFLPKTWLPKQYRGIEEYTLIWAAIVFIVSIRTNMSFSFQASLYFKKLAILGTLATCFSILCSALLMFFLKKSGILLGLLLGEIFFLIILIPGFKRIFRT